MNAPMDSFVISLPSSWGEIDLDPARFVTGVTERARADRGDTFVASLEFRRQLLLLRRILEQTQLAGVVFLAGFGDVAEGDDGETVMTSAAYLVTSAAERFGTETLSFADVRVAVNDMELPANAERAQDPIVIDLGQGPVVRESLLYRDRGEDDAYAAVGVRYFSTIGDGEGLAVLGFITPNVALVDEFTDLFDSIATTLEFVRA